MLNGAKTKLLKAHARITRVKTKRAVLHAPSLVRSLRSYEPRMGDQRIAAACFRAPRIGQAGVANARSAIMCVAAMAREQEQKGKRTLDELFAAEPDRLSRLSFEVAGLYFDWSKTHLDQSLIEGFVGRAERMDFAAARDALFAGEIVNPSEGRPATHVAERG